MDEKIARGRSVIYGTLVGRRSTRIRRHLLLKVDRRSEDYMFETEYNMHHAATVHSPKDQDADSPILFGLAYDLHIFLLINYNNVLLCLYNLSLFCYNVIYCVNVDQRRWSFDFSVSLLL